MLKKIKNLFLSIGATLLCISCFLDSAIYQKPHICLPETSEKGIVLEGCPYLPNVETNIETSNARENQISTLEDFFTRLNSGSENHPDHVTKKTKTKAKATERSKEMSQPKKKRAIYAKNLDHLGVERHTLSGRRQMDLQTFFRLFVQHYNDLKKIIENNDFDSYEKMHNFKLLFSLCERFISRKNDLCFYKNNKEYIKDFDISFVNRVIRILRCHDVVIDDKEELIKLIEDAQK